MRCFRLSEEQRNIINRRLPKGLTLLRPEQVPRVFKKPPQLAPAPSMHVQPIAFLPPSPSTAPIKEETQIKIEITKPDHENLFAFSFPQPQLAPMSVSEYLDNRPSTDMLVSQTYSVKSERTDQAELNPINLTSATSFTSNSSWPTPAPLQRDYSSVSSELYRNPSVTSQKSGQVYNVDNTKHKSAERMRIIVQRFKKHRKFSLLTNALSKMGQVAALSRIEEEIKRNLHTLDSFRDKVVELLGSMKDQPSMAELVDEFLVFLNHLVIIGRQEEFEGSLQEIQKSVDRITRDLTEIKEQGQWYAKKKKRSDRPADQKEIIYICDLIRQLPKAYLVGVWEIINEKPFRENKQYRVTDIDFSQLKYRKIREVEYYVKRKLQNMRKSREQKKEKLERKKEKANGPKEESGRIEQGENPSRTKLQTEPQEGQCEMEVEDPLRDLNDIGNMATALDKPVHEIDPFATNQAEQREPQPNIEKPNQEQPIDNRMIDEDAVKAVDITQPQEQKEEFDSSDSSMVTDDEDSFD